MGKNLNFLSLLGLMELHIVNFLNFLFIIQAPFLKTFLEQFQLCLNLKYLRSYEVYKLGDNSFETDLSFQTQRNLVMT